MNSYDFKNSLERVNYEISEGLKIASSARTFYIDRLDRVRKYINDEEDEELKTKALKVLSNIDRLSKEINSYISVFEVRNLEDVELLYQELSMVSDLLRSERVGLRTLDGFFDRMRPQSSYNEPNYIWVRLKEKRDYYGNINNNINYLINILRKKQSLATREFDEE
jgi:Na+/phosphate symporter